MHISGLSLTARRLNAHDPGDDLGNALSADRTLPHRCITGSYRSSQSRTSRVSAAAAIIARKRFKNSDLLLIHIHMEFPGRYAKEYSYYETHSGDCRHR